MKEEKVKLVEESRLLSGKARELISYTGSSWAKLESGHDQQ